MDPNSDDLALVDLLKQKPVVVTSQSQTSGLVAINGVPEKVLELFSEDVPSVPNLVIKDQRYVRVGDYEKFWYKKIDLIMDRMRSRSLDLGVFGPAPADLADAPILSSWIAIRDVEFGGAILVGTPAGHPTCVGPLMRTSRLCGLDKGSTWARTATRWYRLANPESQDNMFKRYGARVAGIAGQYLEWWEVQAIIADDRVTTGQWHL